jgi:hypothetical protein
VLINQISERLTIVVYDGWITFLLYGHRPFFVSMDEIDELYHRLKRRQLERRLGL